MTNRNVPSRVKQNQEIRSFFVGDSIVIEFWVSIDGIATDGTIEVRVESPILGVTWDPEDQGNDILGGDITVPTVINNAVGHYGTIFVPSEPGWHRYVIVGTGTTPFVRNGTFYVQATTLVGA